MNQTIEAAKNADVSMVNGKLVIILGKDGHVKASIEDKGVKLEVEVRTK